MSNNTPDSPDDEAVEAVEPQWAEMIERPAQHEPSRNTLVLGMLSGLAMVTIGLLLLL